MKSIDLSPEDLNTVRKILKTHLPDFEVWAFGSRVRGTAKKYSDLDLALISNKPLPLKGRSRLQEAFSDSLLPFKVDLIEWPCISKKFQEVIKQDYVVIQKVNKMKHKPAV